MEDLIDLAGRSWPSVPVQSVTGSLRLANDAGITLAGVMCAVANKASRGTARRAAAARRHQAEAGLYRCATCQQTVSASGPPRGGKGPSYRCPGGHVTRAAGRLDEYVAVVINARLARPDAADLLAPRGSEPDLPGLRRRAAALRGSSSTSKPGCMPRGVIDVQQPAAGSTELRCELSAAEGRLAAVIRRERLAPTGRRPDAAALWQNLDLGRQRAVPTALCTVTLRPRCTGRLPA